MSYEWPDVELKVLVACEFSGTVRDAFLREGHDAWSCDLLPDERGSNRHIRDDVRNVLEDNWDLLMVAHPPCTRLCNSGVRWLTEPPKDKTLDQMWAELAAGADLFSTLWNAEIPCVAMENPIMHKHAKDLIVNYEPPAQTVQPWWFGDPAFKSTCLWLRNLPALKKTDVLDPPAKGTEAHKEWSFVHRASPGPDRWRLRSTFFPGIANAMARQWGQYAVLNLYGLEWL